MYHKQLNWFFSDWNTWGYISWITLLIDSTTNRHQSEGKPRLSAMLETQRSQSKPPIEKPSRKFDAGGYSLGRGGRQLCQRSGRSGQRKQSRRMEGAGHRKQNHLDQANQQNKEKSDRSGGPLPKSWSATCKHYFRSEFNPFDEIERKLFQWCSVEDLRVSRTFSQRFVSFFRFTHYLSNINPWSCFITDTELCQK